MKRFVTEQEAREFSKEGKKIITIMYQQSKGSIVKNEHNKYVTADEAERKFDKKILGYEMRV